MRMHIFHIFLIFTYNSWKKGANSIKLELFGKIQIWDKRIVAHHEKCVPFGPTPKIHLFLSFETEVLIILYLFMHLFFAKLPAGSSVLQFDSCSSSTKSET